MSSELLDRLDAVVDELAALPWDRLTDDDVLDVVRRVERAKRRLAPVDHAAINQVQSRSLAFSHGARSSGALLAQLLRISPGEASGRVRAAGLLGPRRTITGEQVEPQFPLVAAAQAAGVVSDRHAAVITRTIAKLPDSVADEFGDFAEKSLVEQAATVDPGLLARHAEVLAYALDQDGHYADRAYRDRTRGLELHSRPDGSAHLEAELTGEAAEHLRTHLDTLARPAPAVDGAPDPRTATQRRHDGFLAMLKLVERAELLPQVAGCSATIVLTMDADAYATGTGTATTGHGYPVPADLAKDWAGPETRMIAVLLTKTKAITGYSTAHRIVTEGQRLALIARDKGCSFPGCDITPAWTQAHHITEFQHSRRTSVENCTLLCGAHHRTHQEMGWTCTLIHGTPHWIPPKWLDPEQTPRRNTTHD
jgi:hypothetical protein